ncbi:18c28af9-8d03-4fd8-b6c3-ac068d45e48d-CDS [Sclerotinia trifoliorum]|uniref:18c28af9-8d03-4fd8-b6c3-ac068d45e48d-CDS n=1 Tax=Sclerotinia trifoliorum TaxID=28548 RepID=A0A8H2ZNJ3_9HELO|nr:18c28af9-8d03-4fd8-b6c3-ac068d45e48d-CDS [Sclerotinia trifoliorum]
MTTPDIMSNNTPPPPRAQQSTIRSFFQPKQPTYTPPPGTSPITTSNNNENGNPNARQEIHPPQPASGPPNSTSISPPKSVTTATPDSIESSKKLPQGYKIEIPQDHHIQPLRRINALLLPIAYPDAFYHAITSPPPASIPIPLSFSRVVTYTSSEPNSEPKVVGSIICRIDPSPPSSPNAQPPADTYSIYLQSLTLLSPYRSLGLATALLNSVIESATSTRIPLGVKIEGLYAHVWVENQEALEWYNKRGFEKGELIEGYYRRLRPQEAWVLRRRFSVQDHISRQTQAQANLSPTLNLIGSVSAKSTPPPPTATGTTRPPPSKHAASFQDRRPDREWNDLPEEVFLRPRGQGEDQSKESSRSSSRSGGEGKSGKKKRSYPAAAFGDV